MEFSLDQRTASLSVGEFACFVIGPQDSSNSPQGIWRAQLGTQWHQQLKAQTESEGPGAQFEVSISGGVFHQGWTLHLNGRIDQIVPRPDRILLREIKTITRPLPAGEEELRSEYPEYFAQLGAYLTLKAITEPAARYRGELVFVEVDSGLSQSVFFDDSDQAVFNAQLERITEFLNHRLRARERLQSLRFKPAFDTLRLGQETIFKDLDEALDKYPVVLFEAPTGFGKTGVTLECALTRLKAGRFERLIYLTSKSTGQLHVAETLSRMTLSPDGHAGVMAWQVRNKREHCIHTSYHCSAEVCPHLANLEKKWPRSGLSRFYLFDNVAHDLPHLKEAGRSASVCPYEITRAALAFNDVWIGDYNYVFSPGSRGLFENQAGYDPARSLLLIDEAHNLPSRVADAYSRKFSGLTAQAVAAELHQIRPPSRFLQAWEQWTHFLLNLPPREHLTLADEDDARDMIETLAAQVSTTPIDYTALGPEVMEHLWSFPGFVEEMKNAEVPRLWWSPQPGELAVTCLDAAGIIGPTLSSFGGALLVSATLSPSDTFTADCGLDSQPVPGPDRSEDAPPARLGRLNKKDTRKLFARLSSGANLLRLEEAAQHNAPQLVVAHAPWRDHAYNVAIDLRVDTSYSQRDQHSKTTASTIAQLRRHSTRAVAVFFPSYRYAETIQAALRENDHPLRVALQPRLPDLASQAAWVEESLAAADILFLVLGSNFAEGIDLLGGRISHAMVVGPALPEVNPVQKARLAEVSRLGREEAFRRVYQAPGIQKVNQALGRLVRAPGQTATVLLHCRRFAEDSYQRLLASAYHSERWIRQEQDLLAWLGNNATDL